MIDIHAHILPGVDDGSEDMTESVRMAEMAVKSGVRAIVVTPHYDIPEEEPKDLQVMRAGLRHLRGVLAERQIPLELYSGMEIFGTPDTADRLADGELVTLADSRYPLIEFPFTGYAMEATSILESVRDLGLLPIVAHPERYRYVQSDPEILNVWFDMGCLLQVNRGSLMGRFGHVCLELAEEMLERGFAAFIASDAHGADVRTTGMKDVYDTVSRRFSEDMARELLSEHPARVLWDRAIEMERPIWF